MILAEDILKQLDSCSLEYTFPMLDNGYVYPAGTHLSAYRDDHRWAMVIETFGFSYRGGGHNGITNCLHIFGNCLDYEPGIKNENFLYITSDDRGYSTFDEEKYFYLNPGCKQFLLRDQPFPLYQDPMEYRASGIDLENENRVTAFEFLRLLDFLHHDTLMATENEIRARIPEDLPCIISIRDWHHPDIALGELPSQNQTFMQLANLMQTGDVDCYIPSMPPNTHWKNWPNGGTL